MEAVLVPTPTSVGVPFSGKSWRGRERASPHQCERRFLVISAQCLPLWAPYSSSSRSGYFHRLFRAFLFALLQSALPFILFTAHTSALSSWCFGETLLSCLFCQLLWNVSESGVASRKTATKKRISPRISSPRSQRIQSTSLEGRLGRRVRGGGRLEICIYHRTLARDSVCRHFVCICLELRQIVLRGRESPAQLSTFQAHAEHCPDCLVLQCFQSPSIILGLLGRASIFSGVAGVPATSGLAPDCLACPDFWPPLV